MPTRVVEGGQTMNPSTGDIAGAIESAPANNIIVLPNNSNVILSAEQAAQLATGKHVSVVATRSVQEGLRAAFEYQADEPAAANVERMEEAIATVRTGEVTTASRDVSLDGVAVVEGDWLGLVDGRAIASEADFDRVVDLVVESLLGDGRSVLSALVGEDGPDIDEIRRRLAALHPGVDVEVHEGGQPHYPLLLWSEP